MSSSERAPALTRQERIERMRARSWVLHILYQWESTDSRRSLEQVMEDTLQRRRVAHGRVPFIRRHVEALARHMVEVDRAIAGAMENWRLDRLPRVDRAVLRLSVAELLFMDDVPPKVGIQEGIRLAGQYGGHDSSRFVNGVLDAVLRTLGAPS
ncbi:MAG: transcription antitermination factor NusB [Gemmatimonadetes bacterium]|nr:transcription antitermination factor NusB [Gemmatimonadota bacterium]